MRSPKDPKILIRVGHVRAVRCLTSRRLSRVLAVVCASRRSGTVLHVRTGLTVGDVRLEGDFALGDLRHRVERAKILTASNSSSLSDLGPVTTSLTMMKATTDRYDQGNVVDFVQEGSSTGSISEFRRRILKRIRVEGRQGGSSHDAAGKNKLRRQHKEESVEGIIRG